MSQAQAHRLKACHVTVRKGNRRAVVPEWARVQRIWPVFGSALIFVIFCFIYVWSSHQSVRVGYTISERLKERTHLMEMNRQYKVELANLTALDRLEHLATNQLGLIAPSATQVQVLR
jgi:hypothetical protein